MIRYRKQAKASRNFILRGHVADRRGKRLIINASLIDGEEVVAQSEGLFLIADELTADLVGGAA